MSVSKVEVLRLYKGLMLYSKSLTLTDPAYFRKRVSSEFKEKKYLSKPKDILFAYQVYYRHYRKAKVSCAVDQLYKMIIRPDVLLRTVQSPGILVAFKHTIDYSRVPKLLEHELSEQFVRGGGPGGSAVNKNANCVVLTHVPTGTVVKCHISRSQDENRKLARELLVQRLDEEINGENSVTAQKRRLEEKKHKSSEYKKKKMAKLKSEWKKREGLE